MISTIDHLTNIHSEILNFVVDKSNISYIFEIANILNDSKSKYRRIVMQTIKFTHQDGGQIEEELKLALQGVKNKRPINIVFESEFGKAVKRYDPKRNILITPPSAAEHLASLIDPDHKVVIWNYQGSGNEIDTAIENLFDDLSDRVVGPLLIMPVLEDSEPGLTRYNHWAHDPYVLGKAEERALKIEHYLDCVFDD